MLDIIQKKLDALSIPMSLALPSGKVVGADRPKVQLKINDKRDLIALARGRVGTIGESIVEGRAELKGAMRDIMAVITGLIPNTEVTGTPPWWHRAFARVQSYMHHDRSSDAKQIQFHYDVSDDFYELWLDPRRVYSCGYYPTPDATLAEAQEGKLDLICRKLDLHPGERFLDIGAGWGGLLLWAAEHYGVTAQGITLSRNQHAYVNKLIREKGLQDRVKMDLLDYRDLPEDQPYDKIASVGMFEHVGRTHMPDYFAKLYRLLRPGGLLMNHGITSAGLEGQTIGAGMDDFIERYIFPGGELLHVSEEMREVSVAGLETVDVENLRPHYAKTLWAWSDALEANLTEADSILTKTTGSSDHAGKILRAYRLYLAGCALAFEREWVSIYQLLIIRPSGDVSDTPMRGAQSDYPFTRNYIYADRSAD